MKGLGASVKGLVVLGALCLVPCVSWAESPVRQITVTGEAEQSFAPDKVDIVIVVEGRGKTLAEAKKKHDELLNGLHQVVAKFGIEKSKVKTLSDNINPQYDYVNEPDGNGRQVLRGYAAEHRLQVTLKSLDKIGDFINAVVAQKIDRIEQVSYGLTNSDDAEMQVTVAAVKDAKAKAQKILAALDNNLGKVLSVNTGGEGYQPHPMPMMPMGAMAMKNSSDSAAPVPSGDVTIRQNVTVQFEIQ